MGDHTVRQHMATPIALAWHRVHAASGASGRLQRATATLEIVLRLAAVVAVADYLRGPADPRVEQHLEKLGRPSLGTWLGLAREAVRAAHERAEPAPFVPEAYPAWFDDKGRPTSALRSLDALVALRNQLQHGAAVGGDASDAAHAVTFVDGLREALGSVHWLMRYRLLWVVDQAPTRAGTTRGRVQLFTGQAPPEPVSAEWTARLFSDAVYLCDPTAGALLELSPLVAVLPEPQLGIVRPFLLHGIHRSGDLVLAHDETGHTERVRAQHDGAAVSWAEWLAARASRDPVQANRDVAGTLSSPLGGTPLAGADALGERFVLGAQLGEGGMAVVYRAHDQVAGVDVAVKMLRPEVSADAEIRARFKREAATMAGMRHPRVLSGVSIGEAEGGVLYIAMPLFEGGTVADRLAKGDVRPEERVRWARQLLEALAYLGERRVVHRDVKPSNLLIDASGDVVLADFGIALGARDARLTRTLTQLGSLAYMAPESRAGVVDASSDAYSAAILLHELYTGDLPRGLPGEGVDGVVGEVIRALGAIDPADRPTAAAALSALDAASTVNLGPPVPEGTNDFAVLHAGAAGGVASALLMALPAYTSVAASVVPGWSWALPGWLAWSGWLVALGVWALAGSRVARTAYGEPLGPAAAAGATAAAIGFGLGGVVPIATLGSSRALVAARVGTESASSVVADAMLSLWWGGFGGAVAVVVAGAAAGAAGGWYATRGSKRPASRSVPDEATRSAIAVQVFLSTHLVAMVVAGAWSMMSSAMLANLGASPGIGLAIGMGDVFPPLLFLMASLGATWIVRAPMTGGFRSARRDDRAAAWGYAALFVAGPFLALAVTGVSVFTFILALSSAAGVAATWVSRREARLLPAIPEAGWNRIGPAVAVAFGEGMLLTLCLVYVPISVGLAAGLLIVPSVDALWGYADPPDAAEAMSRVLRLSATTGWLGLVGGVGTAGGAALIGALAWTVTSVQRPDAWRRMLAAGLAALALAAAGAVVGLRAVAMQGGEAAVTPPTLVPAGDALLDLTVAETCVSSSSRASNSLILDALGCPLTGRPPAEVTSVEADDEPVLAALLGELAAGGDPAAALAALPDAPWSPLVAAWIADQFPDAVPAGDHLARLEAVVGPAPLVDLLRARAARRDGGPLGALRVLDEAQARHPKATELGLYRLELLAEGDTATSLEAATRFLEAHRGRRDAASAHVAAAIRARDPKAEGALADLTAERTEWSAWDEARVAWALLEVSGPERARSFLRAGIEDRVELGQRRSVGVLVRTLLVMAATHEELEGDLPYAAAWLSECAAKEVDYAPWSAWATALVAGDPEAEVKAWPVLADPANARTWRVPCGADYLRARRLADADPADPGEPLADFARRANRRCAPAEGRAALIGLANRPARERPTP